jgi:tetratricopeptide (TPR) repeat protein
MLGPAIAVAWTLTAFPRPLALRAGVVAAIVGLAILSIRQGAFWKDDFSLFEHAAAVNPKSFLAYNNLGNAYYREMNALLAADNFRGAIDARPDYFLAHSNLAAALHELGRLDESTRELQISIKLQREKPWRLRTSWVVDLNHLGQNLLDSGQPSQAAAALRESLAARPDQSDIIALLARADTATSQPASRPASSSVAP